MDLSEKYIAMQTHGICVDLMKTEQNNSYTFWLRKEMKFKYVAFFANMKWFMLMILVAHKFIF